MRFCLDLRATSAVAPTRRAAVTTHGHRPKSKLIFYFPRCLILMLLPAGSTIVDASVGHIVSTIAAENVFELGFSPLGTYVITWQRTSKDENGDATKNLKVWRALERR